MDTSIVSKNEFVCKLNRVSYSLNYAFTLLNLDEIIRKGRWELFYFLRSIIILTNITEFFLFREVDTQCNN